MSAASRPASPIQSYLEELHAKYQPLREGAVATYIPELGKADPDWFGICVVTCDGQVYEVGDTRQLFTIQSISKPLTYGIALQDSGKETVLSKVWMEPSGEPFNSISLDPSGRPLNPMINAGAIAAAGMIGGRSRASRFKRVQDMLSAAGIGSDIYSGFAGEPKLKHVQEATAVARGLFQPGGRVPSDWLQRSILRSAREANGATPSVWGVASDTLVLAYSHWMKMPMRLLLPHLLRKSWLRLRPENTGRA